MAELPPEGWDFEYLQIEPDRRGHPIFRPVVPVRLESSQLRTPDERVKAFDERVVTDINELPAELRARVERTGRKLAAGLPSTPAE